ncbi:MAG TPA: HlyD family efflux transporter periplasmic adaptor subunit [Saprospiraceae bacterium]|nr:HlyD family efflux transporter periplasmic adaptor subunit [Saprospiraceae bacterium]
MKRNQIAFLVFSWIWWSCNGNGLKNDATGVMESDEVIVSAEVAGKVLELGVEEGQLLMKDSVVGKIDPLPYVLQSEQIQSTIQAVDQKTFSALPQIRILEAQERSQVEQLKGLEVQYKAAIREKDRMEKLVKAEAAPGKQLDDLQTQVDVLEQQVQTAKSLIQVTRQQMVAQREQVAIQNKGITSEKDPLQKRKAIADDYVAKSNIVNPVSGTVLTTYVNEGEMVSPGKALYKIADLSVMTLRAYVTGSQLSQLKLNQQVKLIVDYGNEEVREYPGTINWISDKAEFTPKTIQTKDERANLVYATKIRVNNDGFLKLGMYAEVKF